MKSDFEERILNDLLPEFCDDPNWAWDYDGFKKKKEKELRKITEADAKDFLRGLDAKLVERQESDRLYWAPRSCAGKNSFGLEEKMKL